MKTPLVALAAACLLALAFVAPVAADPIGDWITTLPGSHVCHLSLVDHADVPNATVLGPNVAPCETVVTYGPKVGGSGKPRH